jgi:hypothetical protein
VPGRPVQPGPRAKNDWRWVEQHGDGDGVAVWMDGPSAIGIAGIRPRVEWRETMLDVDELAVAVEASDGSSDRFAPAL